MWVWVIGLALLIAGCGGEDRAPDVAIDAPAPTATLTSALELLPTWTPRAPDGPPPAAGPSPPPPAAPPTWTPLPDWCYALQVIEAPATSFTHHPVHLRWVALENAPQYRVELRSAVGTVLASEIVGGNEATFDGGLFAREGAYGWQVTPLDEGGAPTCYALADEIVVSVPPT